MDVYDEEPRTSDRLPYVPELRASQKKGQEGCGLLENETGMLNEVQGHNVEIKE